MPAFDSSHRRVISYIHLHCKERFSIFDLKPTGYSRSTLKRIVSQLVHLNLVTRYATGYRNKHYAMSRRWPKDDVMAVIEHYELARVLDV